MTTSDAGHGPLLFVFSGPSGVGKDSVIERLRGRFPDLHIAVTATTRQPRLGEVSGQSYIFLTKSQYENLLDEGQLLAPAEVHGNWYGAPLQSVYGPLRAGRDVLLKIDVQGAIHVRRRLPQGVFIFLAPPSIEHLVARLEARNTESGRDFARRVRAAEFEVAQLPHYDYAVINNDDDLESTVDEVACIITAERLRTHRQPIDAAND